MPRSVQVTATPAPHNPPRAPVCEHMVIENAKMMRPHCVLLRPIAHRTAGASNTNLLRPMYLKVVIVNIETTGSQGSILANADRFGVAEASGILVEQSPWNFFCRTAAFRLNQSDRRKSKIACLSATDNALNFWITLVASEGG